jgi:glycosyltransferase involved in cell wall biosynthesis
MPTDHSSPLLLFDLTELGKGYQSPFHLSGIPRVVESLLFPLLEQSPYAVRFTSVETRYGGEGYLKANHPELLGDYVTRPTWRERLHFEIVGRLQGVRGHRRVNRRFFRRSLEKIQHRLAVPEFRIPDQMIDSASLFHSFFGPIPLQLRRNPRMVIFLTVHDLIPFQPDNTWSPPGATGTEYIGRAFASLRRDSTTDHVVCVSHCVKRDFCAHTGFPAERVFVTPLAADQKIFHPCSNPDQVNEMRRLLGLDERPYFLSLCRFARRKNLEGLLESFALASHDGSMKDARLVLVGDAGEEWQSRLETIARKLGIENRVKLTGFVPNEWLAPLFSAASAFVFSTFAEGFGLPALESLQCGAPLICSDLPVLHEVAGDAAIYASPRRPEEIARAMVDVISQPKIRHDLRSKGVARAALFSWNKCARATLDAYTIGLKANGHI